MGAGTHVGSMRSLSARPQESAGSAEDEPVRVGPPDFKALPAGAKPEQVFVGKRDLHDEREYAESEQRDGKLDFEFCGAAARGCGRAAHDRDGFVFAGAAEEGRSEISADAGGGARRGRGCVVWRDRGKMGRWGEIQVVRGVDDQLDENAKNALAQWKFRPATKAGEPMEVEVIAHIPFHIPPKE